MRNTTYSRITIPFDSSMQERTCGVPACAIAKLAQTGFSVPRGFCIPYDAYRSHLWSTGVRSLARKTIGNDEREELVQAITSRDIPNDVSSAIRAAYESLGTDCSLHLRHSANDNAVAANAHIDIPVVKGWRSIENAIKEVWASLWSEEAVALRREAEFTAEPLMAIIAQCAVCARASGAASTAVLATGSPIQVQIRATPGVAAPGSAMDRMTIDLRRLELTDSIVARKHSIFKVGADGLESETLHPRDVDKLAISKNQAMEIAEAALWVEAALGKSSTVDWAYENDRLVILGARTIDDIPQDFPVGVLQKNDDQYTWKLVHERPLSWFSQNLAIYRERSVKPLPSITIPGVRCWNGRVYECSFQLSGGSGLLSSARDAIASGAQYRRWKRVSRTIVANSRRDLLLPMQDLKSKQLLKIIRAAIDRVEVSARWYVGARYAGIRFSRSLREILQQCQAEARTLPRLFGGQDSATFVKDAAIQRLAAYKWQEEIDEHSLGTAAPISREIAELFGYAFGTSLDAWDCSKWKSWVEDDASLLRTASAIVESVEKDVTQVYSQARISAKEAEESALSALAGSRNVIARPFAAANFRMLLKRARQWISASGERHMVHALSLSALRLSLLELGKRLVEARALVCADDIFWLTPREIKRLKDLSRVSLQGLIANRKHEVWIQQRYTAPKWLPIGAAPREEQEPSSGNARIMTGIPAGQGIAVGKARVATSLKAASAIRPGEILVVDDIEPAWTSILGIAAGIVIAREGILSAGAIAARDYGIPAVVGIRNAADMIRTGYVLRLNGSSGSVEIVSRNRR